MGWSLYNINSSLCAEVRDKLYEIIFPNISIDFRCNSRNMVRPGKKLVGKDAHKFG